MPRRRVVVTGLGPVTPIGTTADGLWAGLRARRSAVRTITRFDPELWRSRNAAEVSDFAAEDHLEAKRAKRLDRFGQFSVAGARLALEDAGLDLAAEDRERVGAMMGTALGGVGFAERELTKYATQGVRVVDPTIALNVFGGASSCNIAIELGVSGPNSTNAMSCASGAMAIGEAFRAIRDGYADVMFAGGAEAPLMPLCFGAFALIRAMSTRNDDPATASRPFDRDRDGFVMGEAATVLVLEERERAVARGARIYAEVAGYGTTNDAHHMTAPRPDGRQAARAMCLALGDAHVAPHEVGYVNAHGSSTPLNDPTETLAAKQVFGEHAAALPVSGTKGYYGHALGASGAVEAAITALALHRGWLPPTVNLAVPDPACDLAMITGEGMDARPEVALSNSFGFGGINAALVFRRHDA
ncbi:3-oxoacyl-[acyl-carrier-protein] synthase 2 [Gemmatimonadetes bacterium T265]|nr:3-oxoacyl-[acyl-carrier-protein] synthase 2 [Gemmatimonadetes bacterium T265]